MVKVRGLETCSIKSVQLVKLIIRMTRKQQQKTGEETVNITTHHSEFSLFPTSDSDAWKGGESNGSGPVVVFTVLFLVYIWGPPVEQSPAHNSLIINMFLLFIGKGVKGDFAILTLNMENKSIHEIRIEMKGSDLTQTLNCVLVSFFNNLHSTTLMYHSPMGSHVSVGQLWASVW